MKKGVLFIICGLVWMGGFGQKQDRIWCFGANSGIDFNDTLNPVPFTSNLPPNADNSFASIADTNGNLLFYAAGINFTDLGVKVYNKNFQLMYNGNNIKGHPDLLQCCLIIPYPSNPDLYLLFTFSYQGNTTTDLVYSIIDMSQQGGLGAVTAKNIFLLNDSLCEKMQAVKHANGRDWWLIIRRYPDNLYYKYLVSPSGISGPFTQNIGTANGYMDMGEMDFTKNGDRLAAVSPFGCIDLLDFDRCSGNFSNFIDLGEHFYSAANSYFFSTFSPDQTKLYITTSPNDITQPQFVYQYDLSAANIMASKLALFSYVDSTNLYLYLGNVKLAPDGKIYIAKGYDYGPNADTVYDQNLDYITYPDSLGSACSYCSNCFSLQGHGLSELGLPNMPNYNLGALVGSPCDTITTSTTQISNFQFPISIYPNPSPSNSQITFTYPSSGGAREIVVNDINGKEMAQYALPQWSTVQHVKLPPLGSGIYIARLVGEGAMGNVKFVVE